MHLIGARFEHLEPASAALREIRALAAVEPGDVALRALGSTRYEEPAHGYVLAGRFHATDVARVIETVERHGGAVVARRIERLNPSLVRANSAQAGPARERRGSVARNRLGRPVRARNRRPAAFLRSRAAWERRLRA